MTDLTKSQTKTITFDQLEVQTIIFGLALAVNSLTNALPEMSEEEIIKSGAFVDKVEAINLKLTSIPYV